MIRALTRRLLFRSGAGAVLGGVAVPVAAASMGESPSPVPGAAVQADAELLAIRAEVHALEARMRALPEPPFGSAAGCPQEQAQAAVCAEIDALIRRANRIPATTPQGLAVKGWLAMGYCDMAEGDRALRSLCWDLQTMAGRVGA